MYEYWLEYLVISANLQTFETFRQRYRYHISDTVFKVVPTHFIGKLGCVLGLRSKTQIRCRISPNIAICSLNYLEVHQQIVKFVLDFLAFHA